MGGKSGQRRVDGLPGCIRVDHRWGWLLFTGIVFRDCTTEEVFKLLVDGGDRFLTLRNGAAELVEFALDLLHLVEQFILFIPRLFLLFLETLKPSFKLSSVCFVRLGVS